MVDSDQAAESGARVIDLSKAPSAGKGLQRSKLFTCCWHLAEIMFVTNRLQISSRLRVKVLRLFGATIGEGVIFRPRTRISAPWRLVIGDRCWIGDGVWFHNQDKITVGNDVVISQECFLTTGAHAFRTDMALITRPIVVESGAWISSRCVVLGGAHVGSSAVVSPLTMVKGEVPDGVIFASQPATIVGPRFRDRDER